jgi:hypothetical protein
MQRVCTGPLYGGCGEGGRDECEECERVHGSTLNRQTGRRVVPRLLVALLLLLAPLVGTRGTRPRSLHVGQPGARAWHVSLATS